MEDEGYARSKFKSLPALDKRKQYKGHIRHISPIGLRGRQYIRVRGASCRITPARRAQWTKVCDLDDNRFDRVWIERWIRKECVKEGEGEASSAGWAVRRAAPKSHLVKRGSGVVRACCGAPTGRDKVFRECIMRHGRETTRGVLDPFGCRDGRCWEK